MSQKPDQTTAKAGGSFTPHSEGQFAAACVDVVDLGLKVEEFEGKKEVKPKVALIFATGERREVEAGKTELAIIQVEMTNTSGQKGNLRKFLESWRGKSYTAEQAADGLPIDKLWGQHALVTIEHKITKAGNRMAKMSSIAKLPEVMKSPALDVAIEEYVRPKFLEDRKKQYAEGVAKFKAENGTVGDDPGPLPPEDDDSGSDLPF